MKTQAKNLNLGIGLVNAVSPSSPNYPEGAAYSSNNSRIDDTGFWNKGPALTQLALVGYDSVSSPGNSVNVVRAPNNVKFTCSGSAISSPSNSQPNSPSITIAAKSAKGTRAEGGLYYYMAVIYDTSNRIESVPSTVKEHYVRRYYSEDERQDDVPRITLGGAPGSGKVARIYRSKKIDIIVADAMQLGSKNNPLDLYYLGEIGAAGTTFDDYAHDDELGSLYEGRGSFRPTNVNCIGSFDNRLFYFYKSGNDVYGYWSNAGRPENCAQEYNLTVSATWSNGSFTDEVLSAGDETTYTVTRKPILNEGIHAEAIMKIPELLGKTPVRAESIGGKLWLWTSDTTGYIQRTGKSEGYRYVMVSETIGLLPWTLIVCPYGVFGADARGIWQMQNSAPVRISEGIINIDDSGKDTYIAAANKAGSFGIWVDELKEYWWSASNKQIVYQADKKRFVGPYNLSVTKQFAYINRIYQCFMVRSGTTPVLNNRTGAQTLKFWTSQAIPYVTDNFDVEVIYESISGGDVTANLYHNIIASETGKQTTGAFAHSNYLANAMRGKSLGRYHCIALTIPSAVTAPLAAINYQSDIVPREERARN